MAAGITSMRVTTAEGTVVEKPDLRGLDVTYVPETIRRQWRNTGRFASADLSYAQLAGARLTRLGLQRAKLFRADLRKATLRDVDFSHSDLTKANLEDADLRGAIFNEALIGYVKFTEDAWREKGTVVMHEAQLQGARFIDPLLERYARDQAYIYVLRHRNQNRPGNRALIWLWWLTSNYGQSILLWGLWSAVVIAAFAVAYTPAPGWSGPWFHLVQSHGIRLYQPSDIEPGWITPLYFSVSTFMTLGLGDVRPLNAAGQSFVILEVIAGYFMFGVLLSILSNKVARRA